MHGALQLFQRRSRLAWLACLPLLGACAATRARPDVAADLAPAGKLRAAINLGNVVLAQKEAATGELRGVSVDLARELGRRLALPVELVAYDAAGKVADAVKTGAWDVAFLAIDPDRATAIEFTAPYVVIEGTYAVPADSPLRTIEDVDRDGVRVAVGNKSAYDLYLTRTLKRAQLVRAPTSQAAIEVFLKGNARFTTPRETSCAQQARRRVAWVREWGRSESMLNDAIVLPMLPVKDLSAAEKFYEGTLGLKRVSAEPGVAVTYRSGSSTLCVYRSQFAGTNKGTAALWEVDDVEGTAKELKAKGVTFERYDDLPDMIREGDIHRAGEFRVAWFKDPTGNILSIQNRQAGARRS